MAFWKKSEDPWDIDPEKKRRKAAPVFETEEEGVTEENEGSLWNELFKKKDEPTEEETPVPCPYCGKPMQKGYLKGGKGVFWSEAKPGFLSGLDEAWLISDEGGLWTAAYRTCHMCEDCRKLIVDIPEDTSPNYVWKDGQPVPPAEQEEAKTNDL